MNRFEAGAPFDDLPRLPPIQDLESVEVMRACVKASRSLAELQGLIETVPEKRILLELLPLQESESSSAIENIVSSKQRIFMAVSDDTETDRFTKEIVSYNKALSTVSGELPDLKTTRRICSIILDDEIEFRGAGDDPVELYMPGSKKPVYTPPSSDRVSAFMDNLIEYIFTDDEVDPLIKMAVIHYQFEAIHPFYDGNGRTGRILNILYLQYSGLLRDPMLFLSGYIIRNKRRYYDLLSEVSLTGKWEQWILFMLDAVDTTSKETISLIRGITGLMGRCMERAKALKIPEACIDVTFANPFCTIGRMRDSLGCSKPSAMKYLRMMEEDGMLTSTVSGKIKIFENRGLMDLFAKDR